MSSTRYLLVFVVFVVVQHTLNGVVGQPGHRFNVCTTFDEKTERFQIHEDAHVPNTLAWAQYINAVNQTGWGLLELGLDATEDGPKYNDSMKAYAAGLVEGYATRELITAHWKNTVAGYCEEPYTLLCKRIRDFLEKNLNWIRKSIRDFPDDPFWHQVEMFYTQVKGLSDGYNNNPDKPSLNIDPFGLYMLQIGNDVSDLETALGHPGVCKKTKPGHCSAIIKRPPGSADLYVAHNTWTSYPNMLRVLKKYSLPYSMTATSQGDVPPGSTWTFSSYPGYLVSSDDFHVLSSSMVSLETTIPMDNPELYKHTHPEGCLFESVRVWVANRLANSGHDWVEHFIRYNSGTYNNQWMIVDQKKVSHELAPGTLTIVEQLPGYVEYADVTDILKSATYWASYNVAYFPEIFNMSGQQALVKKYGDYFTHDRCRRAQIFSRDHHNVKDKNSLFKLMRYNDFQHDPLSRCNCTPSYSADLAIAARNDLNDPSGTYLFDSLGYHVEGAIDAKVFDTSDMQWLLFDAVSGPTYEQQLPFQWSQVKDEYKYPHYGQPDIFNFKPISFNGTVTSHPTPSWYTEV